MKLAQIAGTDFILIAYSEWAVATGRFVPTSKALAKNVVSIYNAAGKQVFADRADTQGDRTLGAMGSVVVDQNSIGEWVGLRQGHSHACTERHASSRSLSSRLIQSVAVAKLAPMLLCPRPENST